MGLSAEERILPYTLCTFAGAGIMFNITLLIWHCVKFKAGKDTRYIKYAFGGLSIAYIFTGLAITLLILYSDVISQDLCKIGGFLSLFATQESFWMLATSCLVFVLWIKSRMPLNDYKISDYEVTNKWSVPIFILILIVKCIVLAIVSFLPMTNIAYFNTNTQYYYLCTPLRLPGEKGWPYSSLIIVLDWIALVIAITNLVLVNTLIRKRKNVSDMGKDYIMKSKYTYHKDVIKIELIMNVTFAFNTIFWTLILLLVSINYFSGGKTISHDSIQWITGFLVTLLVVLHPVVVCCLHFIVKTKWFSLRYFALEETFKTKSPTKLESVQRVVSTSQDKEINQYTVHWKDQKRGLISGIMKVYHPSVNQKWRNEVRAVTKMTSNSSPEHPNIVKYYWQVPKNKYAAMIFSHTGDMLSFESSLICKSHYAHGNLQQFLKSRIHQLTEVGIHKLTLDIANGLDFIHEKGIVHNMLSTKCVYMASVSEKIGLRAVIGDFENSTEVNTVLENERSREHLYAISYGQNLQNSDSESQFSTDIRAFGVLLLEMLISLSEHNHLQTTKRNLKPKRYSESSDSAFHMMPNSPVVGYGQKKSKNSYEHHLRNSETTNTHTHNPEIQHSSECGCSDKVTDIRAVTKESIRDNKHGQSVSRIVPSLGLNSSYKLEENTKHRYQHESEIDQYLDPSKNSKEKQLTELHIYEDPKNVRRIQQRELPPIPIQIEKVVAEVASAATKESQTNHSPRCNVDKNSQSQLKPKLKPKPNLLKSIQRTMVLNESGESDIDSLYVRSPDSTNGPKLDNQLCSTDSDNSPESTLSESKPPFLSTNRSNDIISDDTYNASVGSFETIYEDDESQDSNAHSLDSGLGKVQNKGGNYAAQTALPQCKRKMTIVPQKQESDAWKKKRLSGASFNDSILSGDSGMGSSHYGTASETSRNIYVPGSRGTICEAKESELDSYSILFDYLERNSQKIDQGSSVPCAMELQQELYNSGYSQDHSEKLNDNHGTEDNFDEFYEMLPDLMIRKKPCRGQHKHISGMNCCSDMQQSNVLHQGKTEVSNPHAISSTKQDCASQTSNKSRQVLDEKVSDTSTFSNKNVLTNNRNTIESVDIGKVFVDESTMTTDSLERQKSQINCDSHAVQTDTESIITELSSASFVTDSSRNDCYNCSSNHKTDTSKCQLKSKPHTCTTPKSSSLRPNNVPKLGLSAVAFSRQVNSSGLSTPLSCTLSGPSGSMQSLATGRSSVMSGKSTGGQSVRSLPVGTNSINSSVLSLLQDSNLLVAGNNFDRTRHHRTYNHHNHRRNSRSNKNVIRQVSSRLSQSTSDHSKQSVQASRVETNHPVVKQIVDMSSNPDNVEFVLNTLKKKGHLGYTAAQLVPLLKDCWLQQRAPSTQDILSKLGQVLPTATV